MKTQSLNLFIVDDDVSMALGLKNFLNKRFGKDITVSSFNSGRSALAEVGADTDIVILDYNLKGENGNEILKSIKLINSKTEVIMLSSNESVSIAIEAFRKGATDYVIKGSDKSWKKISELVYQVITYPIRIMVREFGVSKYVAIFLLTFLVMGLSVFIALRLGNWSF